MWFIFILIIAILVLSIIVFLQKEKFGTVPLGHKLFTVQSSANWKIGSFENKHPTPTLSDGATVFSVIYEVLFKKSRRVRPTHFLPSQKIDLHTLAKNKNILVWFGHSSYFMQIDGKKILVDPVFSGTASPFESFIKSFDGTDVYHVSDIPEIDYLFITHDHWDHLDYDTVMKLKPKIKKVITSLGIGVHFEKWGFDMAHVTEGDWGQMLVQDDGFIIHCVPARHFSGRSFKRNQSLWSAFVLKTLSMNIFIGGDSGYDTHFKDIGNAYGPFDLAILECGQYSRNWKYIHMMPEETVRAALDLKAKKLLPVHWGKFSLALHAWDEPIIRAIEEGKKQNITVIHPQIGQEVDLLGDTEYTQWWL